MHVNPVRGSLRSHGSLLSQFRLLDAFRFVLKCQRANKAPTPSQLFQPIITSSRNSLSETDIYMHSKPHSLLCLWHWASSRTTVDPLDTESNSSYFSDNDIARTHLVCTLFSKGIEKIRGGTAALVEGGTSPFAFALGLSAVLSAKRSSHTSSMKCGPEF
jgi:hypothetical protein